MDNILLQILDYLLLVAKTTFGQIFLLFGPLLILALIMNRVSTKLERLGVSIFGVRIYLYGFAWLGVAIHEIGHAVFALIFGHKITRIVLFSPKVDGTLGSVEHSYNHKNIYHNIGNFFIGIGPIILGSVIVSIIVYLFLGYSFASNFDLKINQELFNDLSIVQSNLTQMYGGFIFIIEAVISMLKMAPLKAAIFLFVLFSIGSSITLSKPDIASAKQGFLFFIAVLLLFNLMTIWLGDLSSQIILVAIGYMTELSTIVIFCLMLNILFIILLKVIYFLKSLIFH